MQTPTPSAPASDTSTGDSQASDASTTSAPATSDPATSEQGFSQLGLHDDILSAVTALGYEAPTPVQAAAVPALVQGRDLLGLAATGTGKTAAFSLPLLHRLATAPATRAVTGIVITPTRELARQVARSIHAYGRGIGVRVLPIYGGAPFGPQLRALSRGVDVVVATPGRARDHLERGTLRLDSVRTVVLDEADEMLDMGFQEDIEALLEATPSGRQTALFSATLPARLEAIAATHLQDPVRVELRPSEGAAASAPNVKQVAHVVRSRDREAALIRVLDYEDPEAMLIFCRTRLGVDNLVESLVARGYRAEPLHGGMSQSQRERVMARLRARSADLVIATDVAARGIDVPHITHVLNYELPNSPEAYTHRIGRTGRAGRDGTAITFITKREKRVLRRIEQVTSAPVNLRPLPTMAELRTAQLDRLRSGVLEVLGLGAEELTDTRGLVEALAADHDPIDIAAAALKILHDEGSPDEEALEMEPAPSHSSNNRDRDRGSNAHPAGVPWAQIQLSLGRMARIGPGDIVGALTGVAGLSSQDIGAIDIVQRSSFVEIRADAVDHVLSCVPRMHLRGRPVHGRRARPRSY